MAIRLGFAGLCAVLVTSVPGAFAQGSHDDLIAKHASTHGVPETLVRRVIKIESRGNPNAVSKGNYGLMQIRLGTARAMGYSGDAQGLLDADTNLKFAVKYLAGAYRAAGCNVERTIALYQKGYYGVRGKCAPDSQVEIAAARGEKSERGFTLAHAQTRQVEASAAGGDVIKPKVVHTVAVTSPVRRPVDARLDAATPQAAPAKALPTEKPEPIVTPAAGKPAEAPQAVALATAAPEVEPPLPKSTRKSDALMPRAAVKSAAQPQRSASAEPVATPAAAAATQSTATLAVPAQPKSADRPIAATTKPIAAAEKPAAAVDKPVMAAVTTGAATAVAQPEPVTAPPAAREKKARPAREAVAVRAAPKEPAPRRQIAAPKKEEDIPTKVVSFFKKLVTPEQKPEPRPARQSRTQHMQAVR